MSSIRTRLVVAAAAATALTIPLVVGHADAATTSATVKAAPAAAPAATSYTAAQVLAGIQQNSTAANKVNTKPHINTMTHSDVNVFQVAPGIYTYSSGMAIDTDGSDPDPDPDHQGETTWEDSNGQALGAHKVPFYVLGDDCWDRKTPCPHFYFKEHGMSGRQFALMFYNGKVIGSIFGDTQTANGQDTSDNDSRELGEASVKAAQLLGIPSSGTTGGVDNGVTLAMFSGPSWVVNGTNANLNTNAQALVQKALDTLGSSMNGGTPPTDPPTDPPPGGNSSYEAEASTLAGGTTITSCAHCSGGKKLSYLGSGGTATFNNVAKAAAGSYTMSVSFMSVGQSRSAVVTVNGVNQTVSFAATPDYNTVVTKDVTVQLKAGNNTIKFSNPSAGAPNLDRIVV
ncbi:glycoside hydrolase family 75 protein [Streptomyces sp. H39-C1]|uniref:glycoside hydrolase family 75 protein n=1 Tax=Streptomyces sp. H39-C1 TaxID=3004355 RepID=UPI0022AF464C|nr:glycoside hydrolase family 75 protein [Streptomyces sp. H39-C1]MCZ4098585.1 glycoside hydrolase family 75 protein [Streptomyces sp. H39-C1]